MKKITLLMLIAFTTIASPAQNKLLSSIDEYYNGTSWEKSRGTNYEYDSNNNLITETYYQYDLNTSSWINADKTTYVYDVNNKMTSETYQNWNTTTNLFQNSYRDIYTYTSGKCTGYISYEWDDLASIWKPSYKDVYGYNANNLLDNYLVYNWDGTQWVSDYRGTLTYNANNKITSSLSEDWVGAQWVNSSKTLLTYNANNKIITYRYADWDDFNQLFTESDKIDYVLDANGNRTRETDFYTGQTSYKREYTYDTFNLMSSFANPFKNKTGIDYLFEDNPHVNKVLSENYYRYNTTSSSFELSSRTTYNYISSITLSTEKFEIANATITVFPNPTQDFLSIQTSSNSEIDKVIITDLSGKLTLEQNPKDNQINVQNLAKGMYVIQVFSGDKKYQAKFLKE